MPDDNQTTPDPTTATTNAADEAITDSAAAALSDATAALDASSPSDATSSDVSNTASSSDAPVSLSDIEYSTPSAYIDPDLPANPTEIKDPNELEEPEEPQPEEETLEMTPEQIAEAIKASNATMAKVAEKIASSRNILIALSSDPSVDELSAAICLSLFLDRLGKHAIAIYSGKTPDALEFLHPGDTFENSADVLQDFVIALNKDKADHLRYRLDGDFVKVFVTPYRDKIVAEDLEFSYGDYNVDLVLALNVNNGIDLDTALREYGRIMHDATVVNISTGNPGKFGEIEWNNRHSSSVSEMIADLLLSATGDTTMNAEEATALLTGIVAATDRFAKANTASSTMQVASRLLDFGADQQLVAEHISDDLDNQFFTISEAAAKAKKAAEGADDDLDGDFAFSFKSDEPEEKEGISDDGSALKISHGDEEEGSHEGGSEEKSDDLGKKLDDSGEDLKDSKDSEDGPKIGKFDNDEDIKPEEASDDKGSDEVADSSSAEEAPEDNSELLDELKATEASLSGVGAETAPTPEPQPVDLNAPDGGMSAVADASAAAPADMPAQEMTINPVSTDMTTGVSTDTAAPAPLGEFTDVSKYSQMLEDALNEPASAEAAPMASALPPANPAASVAPEVSATPEMSGMPEINYGQTQDQVLPPPPAPPVDIDSPMPMPAPADLPPTQPLPDNPAPSAPAEPSVPAASSATATPAPDAFTIPGV